MSLSRNVAGNFESRASHQFYDVISQRDDHVTNCGKAFINKCGGATFYPAL